MSSNNPSKIESPAPKRRLGLAEQVLIGLVLGIAVGVFFGELAGSSRWKRSGIYDAKILGPEGKRLPLLDWYPPGR